MKHTLVSAGNTIPPIYFLLTEKGYQVKLENSYWKAENDKVEIVAEDIIRLAGLIYLYETKGNDWMVENEKINEFINKFEI